MLIGLTGYARSGKDSVANILVTQYGYRKLGFADGVRDMARAIDPVIRVGSKHYATADGCVSYQDLLAAVGYDAAKNFPDVRRLLQRIGTEAVRSVLGENAWIDLLEDKLLSADDENVVISDVRFPNEAEFIMNAGGTMLRVERPGYGGSDPHASEAHVMTLPIDAVISATNLEELEAETIQVYHSILTYRRHFAPVAPMVPKVYLAAPWAHKFTAAGAHDTLRNAGFEVVSTWILQSETDEQTPGTLQGHAESDWAELVSADVVVLLNLGKSDGKASEMGAALALSKRVIVVGSRTGNIFYNLPQVEHVDTLEEAIGLLR